MSASLTKLHGYISVAGAVLGGAHTLNLASAIDVGVGIKTCNSTNPFASADYPIQSKQRYTTEAYSVMSSAPVAANFNVQIGEHTVDTLVDSFTGIYTKCYGALA